ncbi:HAD family hydrolase [Candidatus Woesearchaeota archaeon]|nr:HAD family hydrolase [Candidatus Woesearchaeota archaeon]
MPILYLFDIDGTMVDMTPAHVKAYKEAYRKVLKLDIAENALVQQFGQVEMEIHKAVFRHYRIKGLAKAKQIVNSYTTDIARALKRAHIVMKAIRAAKRRGIKFEKTVVIGDAPFDVHAARKNNAVAVAVATGRYSLEELKSEKPDLALRSLKGYKAVTKG